MQSPNMEKIPLKADHKVEAELMKGRNAKLDILSLPLILFHRDVIRTKLAVEIMAEFLETHQVLSPFC